jgi:tetratricopeptide (TPR) repeat protein
LSAKPKKSDASQPADGAAKEQLTGAVGLIGRLRAWTTGHWLRSLMVAATILTLIGLTIGGWAYLASVALTAGQISIATALEAYDKGEYEEARSLVTQMLTGGQVPRSEYGGPLFVLGAVKVKDAEGQAVPERRRVEYSVAARYLDEARAYGIPADREARGTFLLGQSLIESGQFDEGIFALNELVDGEHPKHDTHGDTVELEARHLLAETCLVMPNPRLKEALQHNEVLVAAQDLSPEQRTAVLLQRAEILTRLDRYNDARTTLSELPAGTSGAPAALLAGIITLDEVEHAQQKVAPSDRDQATAAMADKITAAIRDLQRAASLDEQNSIVAQQASYQTGRGYALNGELDLALKQFGRTRQVFGDSYESLAASIGEGDVLRRKGDFEGSLLAYRRALEAYAKIPVYRSHTISVEKFRDRLRVALTDLMQGQHYHDALALLDRVTPLFSRAEELEMRGTALEKWGYQLVGGFAHDSHEPNPNRTAGLERFRAAGVAFAELADLRFATNLYSADLWRSAEDFFLGQSFSHTIDSLHKYLQYEPEVRNAQAMLRLGQSHLALGQIDQSITALEECIEFHPLDSSTFQARIDCAKAYWYQGNTDRAEQLLRDNIAGSSLKPLSPEWKDSLFELGMLLHEKGKFQDAIGTLEEAVERYPHDSQRLVAQYIIGESYRRWAQDLLADAQNSRTSSEHTKTVEVATQRLTTALSQFEDVQRTITLKTHDIHSDPLMGTMLRNCYMLEGTVLFDLGRYKEAIEAYSNVSSLYPDEPFVLETFVQIANCWRRLNKDDNARGAVHQAQIVLERLPADSDFASTTIHNREEWRLLLANMSKW